MPDISRSKNGTFNYNILAGQSILQFQDISTSWVASAQHLWKLRQLFMQTHEAASVQKGLPCWGFCLFVFLSFFFPWGFNDSKFKKLPCLICCPVTLYCLQVQMSWLTPFSGRGRFLCVTWCYVLSALPFIARHLWTSTVWAHVTWGILASLYGKK